MEEQDPSVLEVLLEHERLVDEMEKVARGVP